MDVDAPSRRRGQPGTGLLMAVTLPSGQAIDLTYGAERRVSAMSYGTQPVVANVQWTSLESVAGWTWPQAAGWSGTHSSVSFQYDLDGRPVGIEDLDDRDLVWDAGNRLVGVDDAADPARSQVYGYDTLDRLTSADVGAWGGPLSFGYDAVGNRTSLGDAATGNAWAYAYGSTHNRLASRWSIIGGVPNAPVPSTYDAMGNLLTDGSGLSLQYDATGRLARSTKGPAEVSAAYNLFGQRMLKSVVGGPTAGTRLYAYDEARRPLGVYVPDSSQPNGFRVEEEYVHLDGWRPVAVIRPDSVAGMSNPRIFPVLTDHLGTPRKVLDGGTGEARWAWDAKQPFGHELPAETPTAGLAAFTLDLRFPGQRFDVETGLFQNGFRDYHPGLGRYIQSDPLGLEAGWNTYGYVEGNPIFGIDPLGLEWFRDWSDQSTPYVVGRDGTIVEPGLTVSKFIEHCVPAGRTFAEIHDARVEELTNQGVPDWKANIPTMPSAYGEAFQREDAQTSRQFSDWIKRRFGFSDWKSRSTR